MRRESTTASRFFWPIFWVFKARLLFRFGQFQNFVLKIEKQIDYSGLTLEACTCAAKAERNATASGVRRSSFARCMGASEVGAADAIVDTTATRLARLRGAIDRYFAQFP